MQNHGPNNTIGSFRLEVDLITPYLVPKLAQDSIELPGIVGLVSLNYAIC